MKAVQNETLTNIFWGIFFIWFGVIATLSKGDFQGAVNDPHFALGTGLLLIAMNLVRTTMRLRVSVITLGLGVLVTLFYIPLVFIQIPPIPFLPFLFLLLGIALIIGAFRTRTYI